MYRQPTVVRARPGRRCAARRRGSEPRSTSPTVRAVDRVAGVRQPQCPRHPQRPRLQRDSPLQLAAAVGDRVAEREHADTTRGIWVGQRSSAARLPPTQPAVCIILAVQDGRATDQRRLERRPARGRRARRPAARRRWRRSPAWPTTTAGRGCPAATELFALDRPRALRAMPAEPGSPAPGGLDARRCGAPPPIERSSSARPCSRRRWTPTWSARRPPALDDRRGRSRSCARSTACTSRCRSTPAGSARSPATCSRRPPTAAVPIVAVGLMYRKGYFRQRIDAGGWQHEYWIDTDPAAAARRRWSPTTTGEPLTITVPIYDADVSAQIWRVDVGRVPLFLLDTDRPENGAARALDHRAPVRRRRAHAARAVRAAGRRRRPRAARRWGSSRASIHLNEGHAALAPLELAGEALRAGESLETRSRRAKSGPCSRRTRRCRPATTPIRATRCEQAIGRPR